MLPHITSHHLAVINVLEAGHETALAAGEVLELNSSKPLPGRQTAASMLAPETLNIDGTDRCTS